VRPAAFDQLYDQAIQQLLPAPVGPGIGRQEELNGLVQPASRQGSLATF
jgi:hypothetical protein